jgi:hypothetical protein
MDPTGGIGKGLGIAAVAFALAVEVAATAAVAIWVCRIEPRKLLVASFALLNLASYIAFIRLLHPMIGKVAITELLIWIVEAIAILIITGLLSEKPLSPKRALAISFGGNLLSFLVGYGV